MRLSEITQATRAQSNRFSAARYLQVRAITQIDKTRFEETVPRYWLDYNDLVAARKTAVHAIMPGDVPPAMIPLSESFLGSLRELSVPLRLPLQRVPLRCRIYVDSSDPYVAEVADGAPIPVMRGTFSDNVILDPRSFAGMVISTVELARDLSPEGSQAFIAPLQTAVAALENRKFLSPNETGSVFNGAPTFPATGTAGANIAEDLRHLVALVRGADQSGVWIMSGDTAAWLASQRDSGGACFPNVGPQGGEIYGMPVITSPAMATDYSPATRAIGLLDPSRVFYADGGVLIDVATEGALELVDMPTNDASTGNATSMVSMYQTHSVALRGIRRSAWYVGAGAAAYFATGY